MLSAFFGSDGSFLTQFAIIFVVIFAVLAAIVLLVRRFTRGGLSDAAKTGSRGRQPRLGIVDVYELDRQRQLILLRRDNVEHLLLVGGPNDVVIERNISRGNHLRLANDGTGRDEEDEPAPTFAEPALAPPPEPIFPPREPAPALRTSIVPDLKAERRPVSEPSLAEPESVEPPSVEPKPPAPFFLSPPVLRPDRDAASSPQPSAEPPSPRKENASIPARILRRTPPPLVNPKPDVASERGRAQETPIPVIPEAPETSPSVSLPPVIAPSISTPPAPTAPAPASTRPVAVEQPDFEAAFAAALTPPDRKSVV